MKFTGNTALKAITILNDEKTKILSDENSNMTYSYFEGETPVIPEYNFVETVKKINQIDSDVRALKHAVKKFNLESKGPITGLTADEILIELPQMTMLKSKLSSMRNVPDKKRLRSLSGGNGSEYQIRNYNIEDVEAEYRRASLRLMNLQEDMNRINLTGEFEVDIDLNYIGM